MRNWTPWTNNWKVGKNLLWADRIFWVALQRSMTQKDMELPNCFFFLCSVLPWRRSNTWSFLKHVHEYQTETEKNYICLLLTKQQLQNRKFTIRTIGHLDNIEANFAVGCVICDGKSDVFSGWLSATTSTKSHVWLISGTHKSLMSVWLTWLCIVGANKKTGSTFDIHFPGIYEHSETKTLWKKGAPRK